MLVKVVMPRVAHNDGHLNQSKCDFRVRMQVSFALPEYPCYHKVAIIHFAVRIADGDEIAYLGFACKVCGLKEPGVLDELKTIGIAANLWIHFYFAHVIGGDLHHHARAESNYLAYKSLHQ